MTGMTLMSPRGQVTGSGLEAEIEFRTARLRRSGGRGSFVDVVATIEEETVLRILAAARVGARVVLVHPRWSDEEKARNLQRLQQSGPMPKVAKSGEFIVFTSGTEGEPKAVLLTGAGFEAHANASAKRLPTAKDDRWLLTLTPAHVGGLAIVLRAHFLGGILVVPAMPLPDNLSPVVESQRITHVSLVPTQLKAWLDASPRPPKWIKCILVGGAPCPPELEARAKAAGWPIRVTYGLSETSSQVATQEADSPPGSVGRPLPGIEVRIDGPPGQAGPILVKGPANMVGYVGREGATRDALVDGWLRTPDVGTIDAKGNLSILGRRDDMIITGGENVDPAEVERLLETHPAVREACVVGIPDAEWGQAVAAAIVLRAAAPDVDQLQAYVRGKVARFKAPRSIQFWESLPRTANGKLQRAKVRERLLAATVPT